MCEDVCLTSRADLELIDALRSDDLLATPPPGATGGSEHITADCYSSGGWTGYVEWETTAPDDELAAFYRALAGAAWTTSTTEPDPERDLARFSRDHSEAHAPDDVVVTVSNDPLGAEDGTQLSVHSEQLVESCMTESQRKYER